MSHVVKIHITLPTKVHIFKAMVFPVVMYEESWVLNNWCFWTVVLEKTLESPLDCKEIRPDNPKGNQSWVFIGRIDAEAEAPIPWPPDVKSLESLVCYNPWGFRVGHDLVTEQQQSVMVWEL